VSNKLLLLFLFSLSLGQSMPSYGADYYVSSSSGNDANNGSQQQPWQTIDRVNQEKFPADSQILFKRGEVFRGEIKSSKVQPGLTFSAYDSGVNPVISGSLPIINWQPTTHNGLSANVYEADISALITEDEKGNINTIEHLFVNGELMTIARYPNVNKPADEAWLKVGKATETDSFSDSALVDYSRPDGYWNDARLRIRTYSWFYRVFKITGYDGSNGQIKATGLGDQLPEWGYFLDDKLEELDNPGEWYYDATTKKVYLYPLANQDPNSLLIEGSTYATGLNISQHEDNTVVENLTFRYFTSVGLSLSSSNNVIVRNCNFEYNQRGMLIWEMTNSLITSNIFNNQFSIGIIFNGDINLDMEQTTIVEKNEINNTGMFPVYCKRYQGTCYGIGMNVYGKGQHIRKNIINKTGWTSIYLKAGGHHLIENNVVKNALSLINDGGAISIGSDANIIRGNFLTESIGNVGESNGCANLKKTPCAHHRSYGMGIGADNNFKDNVIEDNIIANNPSTGIRLNSFVNTIVRNNVIYNNKTQINLEDTMGLSQNNLIEGNIIYSLTPQQRGIILTGTTEHGTFDNKFFCNPFQSPIFIRKNDEYSLKDWQNEFPSYEKNAKECNLHLKEYNVTNVIGNNLLTKPNFQLALQTSKATASNSERFKLQKNQAYRLKFNSVSNGNGVLRVRVNNAPEGGKWDVLATSFISYDSSNKEQEFVFIAPDNIEQALLNFSSIKEGATGADTLTLDNISLEAVDVTLNNAQQYLKLFTNFTENEKTISLSDTVYADLTGKEVAGSLVLAPFSSEILTYVSSKSPSITDNFHDLYGVIMKLKVNINTVNVSWETDPEADGYRLYYAPYPFTGNDSIGYFDMKKQTNFSIKLPSSSAFYVAIKSYNNLDESDYSNIELFIIP